MKTLLILISTVLITANTINTDRPNNTESSLVIPSGSFQLETGYQYVSQFNPDDGINLNPSSSESIPFTIFRVGLADWLELRAIHALTKDDLVGNRRFANDLELGTKIQLLNKYTDNFKLAFVGHIILPTGIGGEQSESLGIYSKFAMSNSLSDNFSIAYNIGFRKFESSPYLELLSTFTLAYSINDKTTIMSELFTNSLHDEFSSDDTSLGGTYAITFLVKDNLQADFVFGTRAIGSGFYDSTSNYFGLGLSWLVE